MKTNFPKRVRRIQAAEILGLSPRTLDNMRSEGGGPDYFKLGGESTGFLNRHRG